MVTTAPKILVATDLGPTADEALRQGDAWARRSGGELIACHVTGEDAPYWSLLPLREAEVRARAVAATSRATLLLEKRVREVTGRDGVRVVAQAGRPDAEICALAESLAVDLLVVGSRDLRGIDRLVAGSVAERVVRYASCPVLVARPSPAAGPVLAATDFSDPAAPAVASAVQMARWLEAPLTVMHALDMMPAAMMSLTVPFGGSVVPLPASDQTAVRGAATDMLRAQLALHGAEGDVLVEDGPAGSAIAEAAKRLSARLVVVGTRGRTGLSRLALGSVAATVLGAAECSVLVVRLRR